MSVPVPSIVPHRAEQGASEEGVCTMVLALNVDLLESNAIASSFVGKNETKRHPWLARVSHTFVGRNEQTQTSPELRSLHF